MDQANQTYRAILAEQQNEVNNYYEMKSALPNPVMKKIWINCHTIKVVKKKHNYFLYIL